MKMAPGATAEVEIEEEELLDEPIDAETPEPPD